MNESDTPSLYIYQKYIYVCVCIKYKYQTTPLYIHIEKKTQKHFKHSAHFILYIFFSLSFSFDTYILVRLHNLNKLNNLNTSRKAWALGGFAFIYFLLFYWICVLKLFVGNNILSVFLCFFEFMELKLKV